MGKRIKRILAVLLATVMTFQHVDITVVGKMSTVEAADSEEVSQDEIRAKYENGILRLTIPKKDAKPAVEEKKHIAIEG